MNVAKWLMAAVLALPLAELTAFILVVTSLGLLWAVALQLLCSLVGLMVLRHAGGTHISRLRVALDQGSVTALNADGSGSLTLLAGILLFIPGFITDFLGLALLLGAGLWRGRTSPPAEGVIDLAPEQWHRIDDPALADRRKDDNQR
jgi:UPF0716 protein FxsA